MSWWNLATQFYTVILRLWKCLLHKLFSLSKKLHYKLRMGLINYFFLSFEFQLSPPPQKLWEPQKCMFFLWENLNAVYRIRLSSFNSIAVIVSENESTRVLFFDTYYGKLKTYLKTSFYLYLCTEKKKEILSLKLLFIKNNSFLIFNFNKSSLWRA